LESDAAQLKVNILIEQVSLVWALIGERFCEHHALELQEFRKTSQLILPLPKKFVLWQLAS
jgi:hypothetical protein